MIQIKRNNKVFFTLEDFGEGSKLSYQLMDHHYIILKFTTATPIYFEIGDSVEIPDFGYFELTSSYFPKHNDSDGYDYEMQMDAYYMSWKNKLCKYRPQHGANETSFSLTTTVGVHMNVILGNLKALGLTYNGKDFSVDYTTYNNKAFDVQKRFLIEYGSISILDALNSICSEDALNCEWWIDGSIIYLGYCEMEGQTTFEQNVNVLSMSYSESKSTYITRLYAFGSDRNIPKGYFTGADADVTTDGVATDYLMLPNKEVDSDGFYAKDGYLENMNVVKSDKQAIEGVVMFDEEYPKVESVVSSIKTYDSTVDNEDGTKTTQTFWQVTSTDSFTNSFKESWIKSNLTLGIKFTSGALMGMEFDVSFKVIDKVNYFEIVANDTYGRTLPDGVMCPKEGDRFFLFNWDATKITDTDLIPTAQLSLFDRAKQYYQKTMISNSNFTCTMDGDKFYNDGTYDYHPLGEQVKLINDMFAQVDADGKHYRNSRIIGMEIPLDIPYDHPQYIVGEKAATSRLSKLEDKVDSIIVNGMQIGGTGSGNGGGVYVIGMNDTTPASDSNVYSARRSRMEFVSRLQDNTAKSTITWEKVQKFFSGLLVGNSNNENGGSWTPDAEGRSHLITDYLEVRMKAIFEELVVKKTSTIGGKEIISPAGGVVAHKVEEVTVTYNNVSQKAYRCYFLAEQEGDAVDNDFAIGDQVRSESFNVRKGTYHKVGNHFYWRLVIGRDEEPVELEGKKYHYIDLSDTDCATASDVPAKGDVLSQCGNRTDVERQNCLIFSAVDTYSPSISLYHGINSYSFANREYVQYGVNKQTNKAFFNVYGDMYVGDRPTKENGYEGSSYIKYDSAAKQVSVKGKISAKSTVDGKELSQYIKDNSAGGLTEEQVNNLIKNSQVIADLQNQVDGAIETWFYEGVPTLKNAPASSWTTDKEKDTHLGDLYYDNKTGKAYRFAKDGSTYKWTVITDTDIAKALSDAAKAQETADGKMKVFSTQPIPPYQLGDIWVNATYPTDGSIYKNEILRCQTAKAKGSSFAIADWTKASKYTDDSALNTFKEKYKNDMASYKEQLDEKVETWFYNYAPTTQNKPASDWTTDTLKSQHAGDLFYNTSNGYTYRWTGTAWERIKDNDINTAMTAASKAQDTADGKRTVFTSQPTVPYDEGDLWASGGDDGKTLMVCVKSRVTGSFTSSEWVKANDSDLNAFAKTIEESLKGIRDQLDKKAETWYQPSDPSASWTTDDAKKEHKGDLWYNTSNNQTFFWNGTKWDKQDVPTEVFDKIDGKSSIYVSKPASYEERDLWILEAAYTLGGVAYSKGELVVATKTNASFSAADWTKKVKYTDDTVANAAKKAAEEAKKAAETAQTNITNLGKTVTINKKAFDSYVTDGYLEPSEIAAMAQDSKRLEDAFAAAEKSYTEVKEAAVLKDTKELTDLNTAFATLTTAKTELIEYLSDISARYNAANTEGKATIVSAVGTKFTNFQGAYSAFYDKLGLANAYITRKIYGDLGVVIGDITSLAYLKKALMDALDTEINGGLVLTSLIGLRDTGGNTTAGINGITEKSAKGGGVAAWFGGEMVDKDYNDGSKTPANTIFRFDGSGYVAGGAIWWGTDGRVHADPTSFIISEKNLGAYLTFFEPTWKSGSAGTSVADLVSLKPNAPFSKLGVSGDATFEGAITFHGISITYDATNKAIKIDGNLYATGGITAYGAGTPTSTGGGLNGSVKSYADALKLTSESLSEVASAYSIKQLSTRITSLEGGSATSISVSGSGNAVTSVTKNGTTISVVKGATFLTSHQSLSAYLKSADAEKTYSKLGHTHAFSEITGKPTTLAGYGVTDGVNAVSVTGNGNAVTSASIDGHTLTLTKGSTFSLSGHTHTFASLTSKPTTIAGYGITDAYTKAQVDSTIAKYLPLAGGTITGALTVNGIATFKSKVAIGDIYIINDGSGNLYVQKTDGKTAANFYATGGITAFGASSVSGGTGSGLNGSVLGFEKATAMTSADNGDSSKTEVSFLATAWSIKQLNDKINAFGTGVFSDYLTIAAAKATYQPKGSYLTSHQTIYGLTIQKNGTSLGTYTPNSAAKTINVTVPTKLSELSNDSGYTKNTGTVTSVAISVPTGLSVSSSPITTNGTIAIALASGYSIPTTAKQAAWDGAVSAKHTHSNKSVLDGITSTKVTRWDSAYGWYALMTTDEETADGIINKWNEVVSFLANIAQTDTLSGIVDGINKSISDEVARAKKAEGVNASGISANKGSITTLQGYFTSGSAKKALQLTNTRKLWGNSFNGTADINGSIIVPSGKYISIGNIKLEYDAANKALKITNTTTEEMANLYTSGGVSAYGVGTSSSSGGGFNGSVKSYSNALKLTSESLSEIASAYSIKALDSRISSLEGGSAMDVSVSGSGNAVTAISKSGTTIIVTKGTTFLTSHQSLASYLTKTDAASLYQPKGNYLTAHQSLDGYVNAIAVSGSGNAVTAVTKSGKTITFTKGATYLTSHQSLSNYYTKSSVDSLLSGKSATTHTHSVKINGTTKTIAASGGDAVDLGTYLTTHQSLAAYATQNWVKNEATAHNADMVDNYHASGLFTGFSISDVANKVTISIGGTSKALNLVRAFPSGVGNNFNDIATHGNSMGMSNIAAPYASSTANYQTLNGYVNPNGQTGWHHYINLSYTDSDNTATSPNMWQTQFAIKAGTTEVYVRSRAGGKISNDAAWAAPWVRLARVTDNVASASKVANALSWSGYSSGSYNGSAVKSISIPNNTNQLTNGAGFITASASITGNAGSATKLQNARTINGTSFNGTANIVTSYWGTTRKLWGNSVNGNADVNGSITIANTDGVYVQIGDVRLVYDKANTAIKVVKSDGTTAANFYATGGITAYGEGSGSSGGGGLNGSVKSYADALKLASESLSEIASAYSIKQLSTRITSLEGGSATSISVSGSGNAVTSVTKNGTTISVVKGATFLTSHQSLSAYLKSADAEKTYSKLGHTHAFSEITGKPTTLSGFGITDGLRSVTQPSGSNVFVTGISTSGTAITYTKSYTKKSLSAVGTSGWTSASVDGNIIPDMSFIAYWNGAHTGTYSNLAYCNKGAFGSFAIKNSLAFSELTSKPATISGYGITDAYTKSQVDAIAAKYLPLTGGTLTGQLNIVASALNGAYNGLRIGDDCYIGDCNFGNTIGLMGVGNNNAGMVKFGKGGMQFGYNGSNHIASTTAQWTNLNADLLDGWHKDNIVWSGAVNSNTANLSHYWAKLFDITVTGNQYDDRNFTFLFSNGYNDTYSVVVLRIRQNGAKGSGSYNFNISLRELVGNMSSRLRVYYNNATGNVQLWGNCQGQYGSLSYTIIKKTGRTSADFASQGTLVTNTSFSAAQSFPATTGDSHYTLLDGATRIGIVKQADQLVTARSLWGQSFNGTANVSGNMTGVGDMTLNAGARIKHGSGNLYIGNSDNSNWIGVQNICSQSSIGDGNWSLRTSGAAHFKDTTINGTATIKDLLSLVDGSHKGLKMGSTYISSLDGEVILQGNTALRFGNDAWDYNQWAGLKYDHSIKTVYLGIADGSIFKANSAQSGGVINLKQGISSVYTPTLYAGGDIYHTGAYRMLWKNSKASKYLNVMNISQDDNGILTIGYGNFSNNKNVILEGYNLNFRVGNDSGMKSMWLNYNNGNPVLSLDGNFYATGGVTAYKSSDERLKHDIHGVDSLAIIKAMGGTVAFRYNADNKDSIGWIAQRVLHNTFMQDLVEKDDKGFLKINYWSPKLIAVAFGAIEQVDDEVSRLKRRVRDLENEVEQLKSDRL